MVASYFYVFSNIDVQIDSILHAGLSKEPEIITPTQELPFFVAGAVISGCHRSFQAVPSATNPPTYGPQKLAGCVEF
jgi:hypothetical protein